MARAGVAEHPTQWEFCGYNEIQSPRKRSGHRALLSAVKRLLRRWKKPLGLGQKVERQFALTITLNFEKCWRHIAKLTIRIPGTRFYGINNHHPWCHRKKSGLTTEDIESTESTNWQYKYFSVALCDLCGRTTLFTSSSSLNQPVFVWKLID
jgi:hypothetical protein